MRTRRAAGAARSLSTAATIWLVLALPTIAASPSPGGGDPRSSGQGPGLVGDPLLALLAVMAIGLMALVLTLAYIRATGRRRT